MEEEEEEGREMDKLGHPKIPTTSFPPSIKHRLTAYCCPRMNAAVPSMGSMAQNREVGEPVPRPPRSMRESVSGMD